MKLILVFCWYGVSFLLLSTGYWLARVLIKNERIRREQEKLKYEISFLRAQINPHFLFNTLGSFHAEAAKSNPDLAGAIKDLLEVLRGTLSKFDINGLSPIRKEGEIISSLAKIYKRRYPYMNLLSSVSIDADCEAQIPPHLLWTVVENVFKHGDYSDPNQPLTINLNATKKVITLITCNSKDGGETLESNGIGQKYIQEQLEQHFSKRYELMISDEPNLYTVDLKIFLS